MVIGVYAPFISFGKYRLLVYNEPWTVKLLAAIEYVEMEDAFR
jgi:hypothetical protein